jgi:malate/lactate dehydrogenase
MSVPTLVTRQGASRTIDITMEPHEQALFEASASAIRASLESLGL